MANDLSLRVCLLALVSSPGAGCDRFFGDDPEPPADTGAPSDADTGAPSDADTGAPEVVLPEPGEQVVGVAGDGPSHGDVPGCVHWNPATAQVSTTGGGTLEDPSGAPIAFEPGTTVVPRAMCNTHVVTTEVIKKRDAQPVPAGPHPTCTAADRWGCPEPAGAPRPPPAFAADAEAPPDPFAADLPEEITTECRAGLGLSFESGQLAGWTFSGDIARAPVFGNNVSVLRLLPPGFLPVGSNVDDLSRLHIATRVGGDYWEYARGVNQRGHWWYGTAEDRPSHRLRPGRTLSERNTGIAFSPTFVVSADFIAFRIGGSADLAQRVELQVRMTEVAEEDKLAAMHQGIGNVEFPERNHLMKVLEDAEQGWVTVRSSSSLEDGEHMGRRVVWQIDELRGRQARLRVIDRARSPEIRQVCPEPSFCVTVDRMAHVNVDDIRCLDEAPPGTEFLVIPNAPGVPVSAIGHVLEPQPIWGFTESHSHVTANLSFGGHMIWGDADDPLENVYNCLEDLPAITDNAGAVHRPAIEGPRRITSCFVRAEIAVTLTSAALGVCIAASAPLHTIPFFGSIIAAAEIAVCSAALTTAAGVLMTSPLITGHYHHGAQMPTGGAIVPGGWVAPIAEALTGSSLHIHGMIEEKDPDAADGTHSGQGLGQFHNHYHKDMIRRAYDGGLRLMVIDVHNSRAMQGVLDGRSDYDDWRAIADHVDAVERLVAPPGDPRWPVGSLSDIAEIARTPGHARDIIGRGKMAFILGVEVMELGKLRSADDSLERQLADMYALGIRKITAIHGTNNPLGGTGLFQDVYQSANRFNNLTADERLAEDGRWEPLIEPMPIVVPPDLPFPFGGMSLGSWGVAESLVAPPCGAGSCPWNLRNEGYFEVTDDPDPLDYIGGVELVTFRLGIPSLRPLENPLAADERDRPPELADIAGTHLTVNRAHSLGWLLGPGPGGVPPIPIPQCSLDGMYVPLEGTASEAVEARYDEVHAHFNDVGLYPEGREFLRLMMARGMLIDTDHFSQKARVDAFQESARFRDEAALSPLEYSDYPVFGVHTELRGFELSGPYPDIEELRREGGYESEISKTPQELRRIAEAGGTITVSVPGFMRDAILGAGVVANDCDFSSKGYAHKYLKAVELMGGRGVTPGFDMNGFAPHIAPRYGVGAACRSGIIAAAIGNPGYLPSEVDEAAEWDARPHLANWPRDWMEEGERCRYNGSLRAEQDPSCPSTRMINAQREEFSGVIYDDYAARVRGERPWLSGAHPELEVVLARSGGELRDDGAQRGAADEWVYVGGGGEFRQGRPLVKWRNDGVAVAASRNTGWDYNLDGLRHVGLMPDLIQDMRNTGVTWELLGPMFNAAEDYLRMWERSCEMAAAWHVAQGLDASEVCAD